MTKEKKNHASNARLCMEETTRVLLIWEVVPEDTKAFIIDANNEELEVLKGAAGKFINLHDDEADALVVSAAITPMEYQEHYLKDSDFKGKKRDYLCRWCDKEVSLAEPLDIRRSVVLVHSGFYL